MSETISRVALVTGGSRGIGRAVAELLGAAGHRVAVNYVSNAAAAEETLGTIAAAGGSAVAVQGDVGDEAAVTALFEKVAGDLGPVEILVNNAGITRDDLLMRMKPDAWDAVIETNLKSVYLCSRAALRGMLRARWGRIVNLSSVAAQLGGVVGPHYAASKAGALGLTHAYAHLLASEGITVNAIAPALVETEMVTSNPQARPDLIPVGRFGRVEETAAAIVLLARNGYITGQTINVNGGWYMS